MRDDAWHEDAYDGDDAHATTDGRSDLDARYGVSDPRANAWTGFDLAIGWAVGVAALLVVGFVHGLATGLVPGGSPTYAAIMPWFAALYGAPVLAVYGVPVAALAAAVLRPVRAEWVHVVAFALLGALGCWLVELVMTGFGESGSTGASAGWFATTVAYGVVAAVAARVVAKRCAIRRVVGRRGGAAAAVS